MIQEIIVYAIIAIFIGISQVSIIFITIVCWYWRWPHPQYMPYVGFWTKCQKQHVNYIYISDGRLLFIHAFQFWEKTSD